MHDTWLDRAARGDYDDPIVGLAEAENECDDIWTRDDLTPDQKYECVGWRLGLTHEQIKHGMFALDQYFLDLVEQRRKELDHAQEGETLRTQGEGEEQAEAQGQTGQSVCRVRQEHRTEDG